MIGWAILRNGVIESERPLPIFHHKKDAADYVVEPRKERIQKVKIELLGKPERVKVK